MTEKSEDQVVWVCGQCKADYANSEPRFRLVPVDLEIIQCPHCFHDVNIKYKSFHSKYQALKSDLEKAVEALENIIKHQKSVAIFRGSTDQMSPTVRIAKEALGKIRGEETMEKELEYFIKEKTKYCAPENWAFLVAQKLIDHGWIKPQPQATSELDVLREYINDIIFHKPETKEQKWFNKCGNFVLAKIDSLKSE